MTRRHDSVVELLRACAGDSHGMKRLREELGIECVSGWQQRCLAEVADMAEDELDAKREEAAFWETRCYNEVTKRTKAEQCIAVMEFQHMKLPVDRNGEVLHIGDEVWFHDELDADPHIIRGYGMTNLRDVDVFLNHADEGWCPNIVSATDALVKRKPDTVEDIIMEAMQHAFSITYQGGNLDMGDKVDEFAGRIRKAVEHV